jgi:hypothetical protein
MFGGYDSHAVHGTATRFSDIWEYDGATRTWYNVTPISDVMPAARSGHTMAFDPTRRVVVLFGGWNQTQGYLGDTWEWNCAARSWTRISPSTSPTARQGGRMMYDPAGGRMILFGGVDANTFYNETWQYTGSSWGRLSTTASSSTGRAFNGRTFHGLAYNSSRGRLVIFGGIGYPNGTTQGIVTDFNDMWELQGTTWTDITPAGTKPGGRGWLGMTYESATNRIVVYGGWSHTSSFSYADTWSWNGSSWSQLVATSPPGARDSFAMTYDPDRSRSVLFGGYWSDLWELNGSTWTSITTTDGHASAPPPGSLRPDFDGDGKSDLIVYRPSSGQWLLRKSTTAYSYNDAQTFSFGSSSDRPLAGDYDGDGRLDFVLWRPSTGEWFFRYSTSNFASSSQAVYQWGLSSDIPLSADFDGDRRNDLVVYRPGTGEWFVRYSTTGYSYSNWVSYQWGVPGDVPMAADFDGDRKTDLAVFRPSTGEWFIRLSGSNYSYSTWFRLGWGLIADKPLVADFDGDGRADVAVFRPSNGGWYILQSSTEYAIGAYRFIGWGLGGDVPLAPLDFDGDHKADIVVLRPSTSEWYVLYSTSNYSTWGVHQWGLQSDVAIVSR